MVNQIQVFCQFIDGEIDQVCIDWIFVVLVEPNTVLFSHTFECLSDYKYIPSEFAIDNLFTHSHTHNHIIKIGPIEINLKIDLRFYLLQLLVHQ